MPSRSIHKLSTRWILVFVLLSTAPELRVGDVQLLEMLQIIRFALVIALFFYVGLKLPKAGVWVRYGDGYWIFLGLVLGISLVALRLPFYTPSEISILKAPLVLSLSRILELALAIYFMLAIADTLQQKPELFRMALSAYAGAGAVSAVTSIIAFVVFQITGESVYFVNDLDHRVQGFFNEGGPYGLFLTSVILVLVMRRRIFPDVSRPIHWAALTITLIASILSFSKAGLLAGILCGAIATASASTLRKRIIAGLLLFVAFVGFLFLFQRGLNGYVDSISNFDETVAYRSNDRNLVMGRITAVFVVPQMIAAHPVLGIGLGNYSLMRNDPDYLKGLPAVDDWDLPGLGLISDAAELGIPLTLFLILLVIRPFGHARHRRALTIVLVTAAFQPIALFLGVNVNFFYPWLVSAFVLAALDRIKPSAVSATVKHALPPQ